MRSHTAAPAPQGDKSGEGRVRIRVRDLPNRKHAAFLGGALLAQLMQVGVGLVYDHILFDVLAFEPALRHCLGSRHLSTWRS